MLEKAEFYAIMQEIHADRMKEQEAYLKRWAGQEGAIRRAYQDFCSWCRCNGYDPYTDSYGHFKEYITEGDTKYKGDGWKLFAVSDKNLPAMVTDNKRAMKAMIDAENSKYRASIGHVP